MDVKEIKGKKCRWIHLSDIDESTGTYLRDNFKFHALDIEDVMSDSQRPKIDIYKYYLFLIAVFPYYDKEKFKVRGREVDIFLNRDTLITVAKNPNPFLDHIFERVNVSRKLKKLWVEKGVSFLLYKILEKLFRESHQAFDIVGRQIAEVEDDVYDNELKSVARDLALIRRSTFTLRRLLDPQRFTINVLVNLDREFIPAEMANYFDNIHDYIEKTWVEVESHRDMVDGLHRTNESLISQHTNRVITTLTVISASLMPLTLLSGIYGMNINVPFVDEPIKVFALFIGVALFTMLLVVMLIRSKKV
ncbi:MAG: magnesium transporter CorA family protein [Patescibacteria group bacterium]